MAEAALREPPGFVHISSLANLRLLSLLPLPIQLPSNSMLEFPPTFGFNPETWDTARISSLFDLRVHLVEMKDVRGTYVVFSFPSTHSHCVC